MQFINTFCALFCWDGVGDAAELQVKALTIFAQLCIMEANGNQYLIVHDVFRLRATLSHGAREPCVVLHKSHYFQL